MGSHHTLTVQISDERLDVAFSSLKTLSEFKQWLHDNVYYSLSFDPIVSKSTHHVDKLPLPNEKFTENIGCPRNTNRILTKKGAPIGRFYIHQNGHGFGFNYGDQITRETALHEVAKMRLLWLDKQYTSQKKIRDFTHIPLADFLNKKRRINAQLSA
ncbi:hypothetical protein ACP3V3_01870 [Vibrio sp. PNB22_3_1]